ncbi:uncharacterized protein BT62DRAFT_1046361 [Guyanagaster necrorhizus]|uniref:DUF6534 domain-containing protein n=1 Tax=Guyanagaster necrorhizus TaxID=856835 RepID=A0A9P8ANW8_9AGAR|nr:uncharacterized protein BT62DRAFT_1046361 [Guyanagaster necrorhizus MCA 3950]KAG7441277.1 hypothetical protein BT62DRAFT_1046361 [Guyanagaster necrorhizus MCA 3950]
MFVRTFFFSFFITLIQRPPAPSLFGITTLQTYLYFHNYPRDTTLHRLSVGVLYLLDTLHLALTIHAMYFYIVTNRGRGLVEAGPEIVWSIKLQVAVMVVIILFVQSLYALRIWLLSGYHRGFLRYLAALSVVGGFGIGIALTYEIYMTRTFPSLSSDDKSWAMESSLAASTLIDFVLALAMCYYLRKGRGSESDLNSRISVVMQYTLSSGLVTSACSLAVLFTYVLLPNTLIFISLEFLLTRLYVGSFLAMLNARNLPILDRQELDTVAASMSMPPRFKHSSMHSSVRSSLKHSIRLKHLSSSSKSSPSSVSFVFSAVF